MVHSSKKLTRVCKHIVNNSNKNATVQPSPKAIVSLTNYYQFDLKLPADVWWPLALTHKHNLPIFLDESWTNAKLYPAKTHTITGRRVKKLIWGLKKLIGLKKLFQSRHFARDILQKWDLRATIASVLLQTSLKSETCLCEGGVPSQTHEPGSCVCGGVWEKATCR